MKGRAVHNMIFIWLLSLGLVGGFFYSHTAYAVNLLSNPGFETGVTYPYIYVDLSSTGLNLLNFDGISNDGDATQDGAFDEGYANSFRGEDMPAAGDGNFTCTFDSVTFRMPSYASGANNFIEPQVAAVTVDFTDGAYDKVHIVGAAFYNDVPTQTFRVNYSDATYIDFTITVEDWDTAAAETNGHIAMSKSNRHYWNGTTREENPVTYCYLFHYTFDVDENKTATNLVIPQNADTRYMAVTLAKAWWDNDPANWSEWSDSKGVRDTTTYRSGSASAKGWTGGNADTGTGFNPTTSISASVGQVYVASAYFRSLSTDALAGGAEAFLKLEFKDSTGTIINYYESPHLASSNNAWERHTVVGTAPPGTAYVQFNVAVYTAVNGASGACYFDDADLHQVTAIQTLFIDSNPLYNESFETAEGTLPRGWGNFMGSGGNVALNSTYKRTGANSVRIGAEVTSGDSAGVFKSIPMQWGQVVEFTAYVKTESLSANTNAYLKIEWYKYDNSTVAGDAANWNIDYSSKQSGSIDWTQLSVIGVAPPAAAAADITCWARPTCTVANEGGAGTASTFAYFDDVEIKVSGGFGQKVVANTPNVLGSAGWDLTFDEGWGGNISSYYDNSIGTGTYHMINDFYDVHSLFDINYRQGAADWPSPNKNQYGRLTVVEQSPARAVFEAYAKALLSQKTSPTGSDYWTITYTVYPDGRMFVTESVTMGSVAVQLGPYWDFHQENEGWQTTFYIEDDADRAGALTPDAEGHDGALWIYETTSSDLSTAPGNPVNAVDNAAQDRLGVELIGASAQFTASSTHTHHWMVDISEDTYTTTLLDNKGLDYKTHTSGTYGLNFTGGVGSLLNSTNSINTDVDQDGFDEGAGCWNVKVGTSSPGTNGLRFILQADATVTRYKPAFFITGYTDTQLPASVEVAEAVKEQGTDYNIAFVPFSRVYKRYNSPLSFSNIYAEGLNNRTTTITVNNPDNPVDVSKTDDYASWLVNTDVLAAAGVLDLWGFDLGSRRDIDTCTVSATYYAAATSGTADSVNIYGFISDFDQDETFGESSPDEILVSQATTAAADSTASQAIGATELTDTLLKKLEVRAYTDLVTSNTPTYQARGTDVSGTGAVTPTWPAHAIGDIALLFIESCGGEAANLSTPSGFAAVTNSPQATGVGTAGTRLTVYWCRATSTSMAAPVVADPGNHVYAVILTFRGCVATGDPWDVTDGGVKATASTTTTFGAVTTTVPNCLIVLAASRDNDSGTAAWSSWTNANLLNLTERQDAGAVSGNGGGVGVAEGGKETAGSTGASTATVTSTVDGHMTIALKPPYSDKTCYLKNAYIGGTYYATDITDSASAFNTYTEVFSNQSDYLYVGSKYKFSGILVDLHSAGSATITPAWQYYNGSAWTTLTVTDNTSGFMKDGMITFTAPADWAVYNRVGDGGTGRYIGGDFYSESLYYVRIQRTAVTLTSVPNIRGVATNNLIFQYMSNVSTNTEFALVGATLVDLIDFNAIGYFGKVKLFWKTESEFNNIGFNILRSEDAKNYVKVNKEIIPGLGTNIMGREYTYEDADVINGKTYYYLLEDVEGTGKTTRHGPVAAHPGVDFDADGMTDDWEYYYGLPATVYDANVDSDDDGLTNIEEFAIGSNPLVIDSENFTLSSQNSGVRVVESEGLRTVLELNTTTLKVTNKSVDGVVYQLITLPEYTHGQTADVGKPQLPTKGVLFGTLSKKPVTINILETEKETYSGYNIYPVPKAVFVEDPVNPDIKRLTYEFYKDTNTYAVNAFYIGRLAEADYSNYLQDQKIIKIIFYPIQFNPVSGKIEFYKRIRLEVIQEGAEPTTTASSVSPKEALPLTEDNAYKIYINEDGIYRLTKSYLESKGMSLSGADPRKLKVYNQGAEIPIYVYGEEDGIFDTSDYIEFYAQAVDTRYSGTNVYWLVLSDSAGLRMTASSQVEDATTTPGSFLDTYRKEINALYWMESKGSDHWFAESIYGSDVYDLALDLNGVASVATEATLKVAVEGSTYSGADFTHHLYLRLNGVPITESSWKGGVEHIIEAKVSQSYLNEGINTVTVEVAGDNTGYEEILVNWAEITYWRKFTAQDNALKFGNYTSGAYLYQISGFTKEDIEIYDITEPKSVQRITLFTVVPEGTTFTASFKDIGSKKYTVLAKDKAKVPAGVSQDEPSDLTEKANRADYIIIVHSDFYDTILPFADYRSGQGLKVKVVKLDDIYDEFNYGIADVQAIKDFLKYAYYNWTGPKPAYVLLAGDATYDYRDYSGYGFTNYVPTYLFYSLTFGETGSDNWFVCFDGENDIIPDMLIGRFPIKTTDELRAMINKIIRYEAQSADEDWTKKVLLVADDDEKIFGDTSEKLASYLTKGYTADRQYLGTTTNNPAVLRQNIITSINSGRLFVNYTGHGGIGLWANERIFTWDDIKYLYNGDAMPVFTTLTCANGYFVYPRYIESLGERLVNVPDGGAIASFVPSGISYPTTQSYLADGFYSAFFDRRDAILGSMMALAKLKVYENELGGDAENVIQTYNLFGDPAMRVRMKAQQIPAVAAPQVFNLDKGKVNEIFMLTEESQSAASNALADVIVSVKGKDEDSKKEKKGLTKIIHAEGEASAPPSVNAGASEDKLTEYRLPDIATILEDKTADVAPPKFKVLGKADIQSLKKVKTFAKINYGAVKESATDINRDAKQLAELRTKFDEAIKEADFQKAKSILRVITRIARKIYWRRF